MQTIFDDDLFVHIANVDAHKKGRKMMISLCKDGTVKKLSEALAPSDDTTERRSKQTFNI